jgi:hypothetical protein
MTSRIGWSVTNSSEAWLEMQRLGAGDGLLRDARRVGAWFAMRRLAKVNIPPDIRYRGRGFNGT